MTDRTYWTTADTSRDPGRIHPSNQSKEYSMHLEFTKGPESGANVDYVERAEGLPDHVWAGICRVHESLPYTASVGFRDRSTASNTIFVTPRSVDSEVTVQGHFDDLESARGWIESVVPLLGLAEPEEES